MKALLVLDLKLQVNLISKSVFLLLFHKHCFFSVFLYIFYDIQIIDHVFVYYIFSDNLLCDHDSHYFKSFIRLVINLDYLFDIFFLQILHCGLNQSLIFLFLRKSDSNVITPHLEQF